MQKKKPLFVVISGLSAGVGKDTVMNHLVKKGFERIVTVNTRAKRAGEVAGKDYIFIDDSTFKKWKREGKFLETVKIVGSFRGVLKSSLNIKKKSVLRVDGRGLKKLKGFKNDAVTIFLSVKDPNDLKRRMTKRGDSPKLIEEKLRLAESEYKYSKDADYLIYNEDGKLKETLNEMDKIISRERKTP